MSLAVIPDGVVDETLITLDSCAMAVTLQPEIVNFNVYIKDRN